MTLYRRQGARPSPRKRNTKRQNGFLEEALQIAERREAKGKGEKERYTIARRDKKESLSDQHKEIEKTTERERLEISSRKLET